MWEVCAGIESQSQVQTITIHHIPLSPSHRSSASSLVFSPSSSSSFFLFSSSHFQLNIWKSHPPPLECARALPFNSSGLPCAVPRPANHPENLPQKHSNPQKHQTRNALRVPCDTAPQPNLTSPLPRAFHGRAAPHLHHHLR